MENKENYLKTIPIPRLLWKLSPPVMAALLIQSIYNIVDSYFIAADSPEGLTALSIIYPIQLLMVALATGTGTGLGVLISRMDGLSGIREGEKGSDGNDRNGESESRADRNCESSKSGKNDKSGENIKSTGDRQSDVAKSGVFLGFFNYIVFTVIAMLLIGWYYGISSDQAAVRAQGIQYAQIILMFSLGQFLEGNTTKMLQAKGDMITPMAAQIVGAVINIILDPILIFGMFGVPQMGIRGAAIATVIGQWTALIITAAAVIRKFDLKGRVRPQICLQIYRAGLPSIVMQSLYTLYIVGLNLILKQFTEDAVTVLGIYYKLQAFFYIPLFGLQQVILPVISFNYGAALYDRVRQTVRCSIIFSCTLMFLVMIVFLAFPRQLLSIFSHSAELIQIGCPALRIISFGCVPAAPGLVLTVYFQGVDRGRESIFTTLLRQVFLLVPLAWLFSFFGLTYVWLTFPVTEVIIMVWCLFFYFSGEKDEETLVT